MVKKSGIGTGFEKIIAAALMTAAETGAGQQLSNNIASSLCEINFKDFLKDVPGFAGAAASAGSFFGEMFE